MADVHGWLRRVHPPIVTATLIGAVVATGVRFDVYRRGLPLVVAYRSGFSGRALLARRFDTVLSSQLLTRDGFMLISIVLSLAVMLGGYELIAGSRRATVVAVASAVVAPVSVALALALGSALRIDFATQTLSTLDYGASTITAGGGGALVAVLGRRWLWWAAFAFVIGGLTFHHQFADWEHLVAFPLGYAIATFPRWPLLRRRLAFPAPAPAALSRSWRIFGSTAAIAGLVVGGLVASDSVAAPLATTGPPAPVPRESTAPTPVLTGASSTVPPKPPPTTAAPLSPLRVVDGRYATPSLGGGDRRALIALPAGYDSTGGRYPVIEILHGRPGRPDDILTGLDLVGVMGASAPFIAVMPDGHGPQVSDGDFADTSRQRLGAALSEDLRTWVDATYRTTGHWGVTGLSAGGYGASYLASRPQGGYRRACPMSGYFTAEDPPFQGEPSTVREAASPLKHVAANGPPTLVIVGEADAAGLDEAHRYVAAMTRVGQANQLAIVPGAHDFNVWHAALPRCIEFLLAESA